MPFLRLLLACSFLFVGHPLLAETAPAGDAAAASASVQELDKGYSLFPVARLGNSLYLKKKRIFTRQDLVIRAILPFNDGVIYYGVDAQEQPVMGWLGKEGITIAPLEGGFFQLTNGTKRSLLRLTTGGKIQDLLPKASTPGNLVIGPDGKAAFSHIQEGQQIEEEGKVKYLYTFRVHIVRKDQERIETLPDKFITTAVKLRYEWADPRKLEVWQDDGQKQAISVR